MNCDVAREALSARIDGEAEPVPRSRVDEHLQTCAECRQWYFDARESTRQLRDLAGQSRPPLAAVDDTPPRARRVVPGEWARWALGAIGAAQLMLAVLQAAGVAPGVAGHTAHAPMSGHLLNESTAWTAALGAAMVVAALRPVAAAGLSAVLVGFSVVLAGYVTADALSSAVTALRVLSHLPVLVGTVLAVVVWRGNRPADPDPQDWTITLPDNASRGRRRGHLRPTDGSAA